MRRNRQPYGAAGRRPPPDPAPARGTGRDDGVVGVFKRAAAGHGFVRPLGAADATGDIRVAAVAAGDAATGDTVRVRSTRSRDVRRPGPAGCQRYPAGCPDSD